MAPLPYRTDDRGLQSSTSVSFVCENCAGVLHRVNRSLVCQNCDHVPKHGAD